MLILAAILSMAQPGPEPVLAGPAVKLGERSRLVQYEMNGRVIRPVKTIEQAAVDLLPLTPEVRERVDRVLTERAAAIDRFVIENLMLLGQFETIQAAGSLRDKIVLGVEAVTKLGEAIGGRSLRESIVAELPPDQATAFRAALRGYWTALHEEGKALKPKDPPPTWAVYLGESFASLGREITSSFERQSASGTLFVDYLVAGLGLTQSQRDIIHELKLDLLERTNMRPTEEEQQKLILGAAAYLNHEQRAKVIERVTGAMKRDRRTVTP